MFDLVADISKYKEFLPWCSEAVILTNSGLDFSDIIQNNDRGEFIASLSLSYGFLKQTFTTKDILSKESDVFKIEIDLVRGPFSNFKSGWLFQLKNNGFCEVNFFIEFNVNNLLIKKPLEMVLNKISKTMVNSFKLRADEVYGELNKSI